ncbi:CDP-2,3-bis-(O-geranylgeranyl)-sn-glycerol synthase [Candidatus Micrarchaeota archaeon]|nr:CDP-2,3-bis-(O-geranylgeranyl)-sn-glycerol synthase [Candidatus Micrarchaeota archaeon]
MLYLLLLVIPAFFANAIPVLLGGGRAIDNDRQFMDGRPILGKHKTIRGFIAGVFIGMFVCELLYLLEPLGIVLFMLPVYYAVAGFILGFGTMLGDSIGSFIKRRFGYKSGKQVLFLDELSFIIVALIFILPILKFSTVTMTVYDFIIVLALAWVLHKIFNIFANKFGVKNVPW